MPSLRECIVLVEAAALAVRVEVGLRTQSPKMLISRLGQAGRHGPALFRLRCLRQSLILFRILKRRSIPAELRIGVRRVGDNVNAHAWIEYDGQVLLDGGIADEYATLPLKS